VMSVRVWFFVGFVALAAATTRVSSKDNDGTRPAEYSSSSYREKYHSGLSDKLADAEFTAWILEMIARVNIDLADSPTGLVIDDVLYEDLFGESKFKGLAAVKSAIDMDATELLRDAKMVKNRPLPLMGKCQEVAKSYSTMAVVSGVGSTLVSAIPGSEVVSAIREGSKVAGSLANAVGGEDKHVGRAVGRTVEVAGTSAGDITLGILTLGILPAVGAVGKAISSAAMMAQSESMVCSACLLSAMLEKTIHAGTTYEKDGELVKDWEISARMWQRLQKGGAFAIPSDLQGQKYKQPNRVCGWDLTDSEMVQPLTTDLIFEKLKSGLIVAEGFRNAFDIIGTPFGGISRTTRQWAMSNSFQGGANMVGRGLVRFLRDKFWRPMLKEYTPSRLAIYAHLALRKTRTDVMEANIEKFLDGDAPNIPGMAKGRTETAVVREMQRRRNLKPKKSGMSSRV